MGLIKTFPYVPCIPLINDNPLDVVTPIFLGVVVRLVNLVGWFPIQNTFFVRRSTFIRPMWHADCICHWSFSPNPIVSHFIFRDEISVSISLSISAIRQRYSYIWYDCMGTKEIQTMTCELNIQRKSENKIYKMMKRKWIETVLDANGINKMTFAPFEHASNRFVLLFTLALWSFPFYTFSSNELYVFLFLSWIVNR